MADRRDFNDPVWECSGRRKGGDTVILGIA
jgi:hypothetical protein